MVASEDFNLHLNSGMESLLQTRLSQDLRNWHNLFCVTARHKSAGKLDDMLLRN